MRNPPRKGASQGLDFLVLEGKSPGLDDVEERKLRQVVHCELHNLGVGIDLHARHLLQPEGEVQLGGRVVGGPARTAAPAPAPAAAPAPRGILHAGKGEDVVLELRIDLPGRDPVAIAVDGALRVDGERAEREEQWDERNRPAAAPARSFSCSFSRSPAFDERGKSRTSE